MTAASDQRSTAVEPALFIVFGATGDLMRRKLLPALYRLAARGTLPRGTQVLGVARDEALTEDVFRERCIEALIEADVKPSRGIRAWCRGALHYQPSRGDPEGYRVLAQRIEAIEQSAGHLRRNRVFYLALPPGAFPSTIDALGEVGLNRSSARSNGSDATAQGWTRLVIEKPFGRDLASAKALNTLIHRHFDEQQVYRIDHYLGKETVQNLLAFRFGNALFESAWNRDHVESVRISVDETLGIEQRAGYYEQAGALRDMVQNHLTQLLTLTAMEVPAAFEADAIRYEKVKVLAAVREIAHDDIVRAQYGAGVIDGKRVAAYREEPGVARRSGVETFVGLRLAIDNWRWQGVPFLLSTGKRLARRATKIVIAFRKPPIALFKSMAGCDPCTNVLTIALQPDEGFALSFEVKTPGDPFRLQTETMRFRYPAAVGAASGYETLLLDIVEGDQTLFVHAAETEASWRLYQPILERPPPLRRYAAGSAGPDPA